MRPVKSITFCALLSIFSAGCSSANDTPAADRPECADSEERACIDDGGCEGTAICVGGIWSECACDKGGGDTKEALGGPCVDNSDCSTNAHCLTEEGDEWFGGGPPGGICVADCSLDPLTCESFEGSVCVLIEDDGDRAYCLQRCSIGDGNVEKCGERDDIACEPLDDDGDGFCRPFCTTDDACAGGRCDKRHGTCVEDLNNVDDFGTSCTLDDDDTGCSGLCVQLSPEDSTGYCTHRCRFGSTSPCSGDSQAPSLCAFAAPQGSLGDIGYCAQLCNCTEECSHPESACDPFTSQSARDLTGSEGVCAPPTGGADELMCVD